MTQIVTYATGMLGGPLPGAELDFPNVDQFPLDVSTINDPRALEGTSLMVAVTLTDPSAETLAVGNVISPLPGAELDFPTPGAFNILGSGQKYWLAANRGITTIPSDTPANTRVPGALVGKLNYQDSLFNDVDPFMGNQLSASQAGRGVLNLLDPNGSLFDSLMPLSWDGALVEIYRGKYDDLRSAWTKIATMTTSGMLPAGDVKQIRLRDGGWKLETEIQPVRYAGTGGIEGDATLKGTSKPYGIGYCFRVPAVLLNAASQTYQVSNSSCFSFDIIQDGGLALTFAADYPTFDALVAASIPNGFYATCKARGCFRLGAVPTKQVTCTFCGDNDNLGGKTHPVTRADIVRRIACGLGRIRLDPNSELDALSFSTVDNNYPQQLGYWWNQPITKAEAIRQVMMGLSGYMAMRFDGKLIIGAAELPVTTPYATLTFGKDFKSPPKLVSYSPPRFTTIIGYQRNYTIQTQDQLQLGVDAASVQVYGMATLLEQVTSIANQTIWPTSEVITIDGGFRLQVDARNEATRQQNIFGMVRRRWQVETPADAYGLFLGRVLAVAAWSRYDFAGGKSLRVVAQQANDAQNILLDLWG